MELNMNGNKSTNDGSILFFGNTIEYMKSLEDNSIDTIVTDPPYLVNYKTNRRKTPHKFCHVIQNDNNFDLVETYMRECYRIMKPNTAMFMFCSSVHADWFKQTLEKIGFKWKSTVIWVKNCHTAGDLAGGLGRQYECIMLVEKGRAIRRNTYRYTDVWNFNRVCHQKLLHQNQKPLDLIKRCIELYSVEGDTVFDGFMGSGTTGVAAKEMNRNFIGVEIDKEYFDIAKERIERIEKNGGKESA